MSNRLRDFQGYGATPPNPQWPDNARVTLSIVVNIEEGAELAVSMGDERNESVYEAVEEVKHAPDLCMESHYEYGTRVGIWRILNLLDQYAIKATMNVCARSFEVSPWLAKEIVSRGHEICCHGYRWERHADMDESTERQTITRAIQIIEQTAGVRPVGWHTRSASSVNTRRLLVEHGFLYDSDAYNDELPYFVEVTGQDHLVIPYSFDTNDMNFHNSKSFRLAQDFATYLIDSFNWLWDEGLHTPRMMSVGLHTRIIGRPGRIGALKQFLDHVTAHPQVWIARRDQIAQHWRSHMS